MEYNADTPRKQRQIGEFIVNVPQPFAEGHVCTAGEAAALNQTVCENLSNNLRQKLKDGVTTGEGDAAITVPFDEASAQQLVDDYLVGYEMGVRSSNGPGRAPVDPVEREALRLAKEKAKEIVKAKGLKVKDVDIDSITQAIYDNNVEALTAAAKKVVAAKEKAKSSAGEIDTAGLDI